MPRNRNPSNRGGGPRRSDQKPARESEASGGSALIATHEEVAKVAERLATQPVIAFDTEFLRERTFYPQLGLIQIADREDSWLLDPLELSQSALQPLLDVFTDPNVLKVGHALEQDQECLYRSYGTLASPILDTSIAAALTGRGDQIGLSALLEKLLGIRLKKTHTRTDWLKRPLPEAMAEYARLDVDRLVEASDILLKDLERRGRREWALAVSGELAEASRYEPNPDALAQKLASNRRMDRTEYAVLRELVRWRENSVRSRDLPRKWLAEDQLLVKLAAAHPTRVEDLAHFRGLGAKMIEHGAKGLLGAIQRGLDTPVSEVPRPPERNEAAQDEQPALSVLRCFTTMLAREHDVAMRFVVDPDALLALLRGRFETIGDLRAANILGRGAVEMFGDEMIEILNGRRALRLESGRLFRYTPNGRGGSLT